MLDVRAIDGYARCGLHDAKRDRIEDRVQPLRVSADVELKLLAAGDRVRIRDELRVRQADTDSS